MFYKSNRDNLDGDELDLPNFNVRNGKIDDILLGYDKLEGKFFLITCSQ